MTTILPTMLPATLPPYDKAIDITAETCPMTFVRTRLALWTPWRPARSCW